MELEDPDPTVDIDDAVQTIHVTNVVMPTEEEKSMEEEEVEEESLAGTTSQSNLDLNEKSPTKRKRMS